MLHIGQNFLNHLVYNRDIHEQTKEDKMIDLKKSQIVNPMVEAWGRDVDFITEKQRYEHEIKLWREFYDMAITQCHPEMVGIVLAERWKDFNYIQEKYGKATVA